MYEPTVGLNSFEKYNYTYNDVKDRSVFFLCDSYIRLNNLVHLIKEGKKVSSILHTQSETLYYLEFGRIALELTLVKDSSAETHTKITDYILEGTFIYYDCEQGWVKYLTKCLADKIDVLTLDNKDIICTILFDILIQFAYENNLYWSVINKGRPYYPNQLGLVKPISDIYIAEDNILLNYHPNIDRSIYTYKYRKEDAKSVTELEFCKEYEVLIISKDYTYIHYAYLDLELIPFKILKLGDNDTIFIFDPEDRIINNK